MFSPDGRRLLTWAGNNAYLWDASSERPLHSLKGHEDWVYHAAFSLDGKAIVTASEDNTARIWDALSGRPLHTLEGHQSSVRHAAFSLDGNSVVTASADLSARIWDAPSPDGFCTLLKAIDYR